MGSDACIYYVGLVAIILLIYYVIVNELVRYSACLGEDNSDLQKALELMLSVPHRAQDEKFTSSIEGYRGSIHKLGRLLAHDWFSLTTGDVTKERYLFLFKGKILICKVRRISEDRSVFQLKDIIQLNRVAVKDHPEEERIFELIDAVGGQSLTLTAHRDHITEYWLKEIKEFAKLYEESEETEADDFQVASPPTEPTQTVTEITTEKQKLSEVQSEEIKPSETTETKTNKDKSIEVTISPEPVEEKPIPNDIKSEEKQSLTKPEETEQNSVEGNSEDTLKATEVILTVAKSVEATEQNHIEIKSEKKPKPTEFTPTSKEFPEEIKLEPTEIISKSIEKSEEKLEFSDANKLVEVTKTSVEQIKNKDERPKLEELKSEEKPKSKESVEDNKTNPPEVKAFEKDFTEETHNHLNSVQNTKTNGSEFTNSYQKNPTSELVEDKSREETSTKRDLRTVKAVESLVQNDKKQELEESIPCAPNSPKDVLVSALNKSNSVEQQPVCDTVVTGNGVGVEVNVEISDDMSRRYTSSSARAG